MGAQIVVSRVSRIGRSWRQILCSTVLVLPLIGLSAHAQDEQVDDETELEKDLALAKEFWESGEAHEGLQLLCSGFRPFARLLERYQGKESILVLLPDADDNRIEKLKEAWKKEFSDTLLLISSTVSGTVFTQEELDEIWLWLVTTSSQSETLCAGARSGSAFYVELTARSFYGLDYTQYDVNDRRNGVDSGNGVVTNNEEPPAAAVLGLSAYVSDTIYHKKQHTLLFEGLLESNDRTNKPPQPFALGRVSYAWTSQETVNSYRPHDLIEGVSGVLGLEVATEDESSRGVTGEVIKRKATDRKMPAYRDLSGFASFHRSSSDLETLTVGLGFGWPRKFSLTKSCTTCWLEFTVSSEYNKYLRGQEDFEGGRGRVSVSMEFDTPAKGLFNKSRAGIHPDEGASQ